MAGVIHASHCHSTVHAQQQTHRCKGYTRHAAAVAAPLGMPAHERQAEASSHVRCTTHIDLNSQHERPGAYIRPFDSRSPSAGGVTTAERARRTEAPTPLLSSAREQRPKPPRVHQYARLEASTEPRRRHATSPSVLSKPHSPCAHRQCNHRRGRHTTQQLYS